jgi:cytochrome c peroxidase
MQSLDPGPGHSLLGVDMKSIIHLIAMLGLLTAAARASESDAGPVSQLRNDALAVSGVLPDKMPGSGLDTPERIELGRRLFFDPRLSANQTMSCNTCHRVDGGRGGVDNEPTSPGAFGKRGDRNAPTVLNAGFHLAQFWDGRAAHLQEQAKGPVLNPVEMAMPSDAEVLKRLGADREYVTLFKLAFPRDKAPMRYDNVAEAIAAFERTLITRDLFDDFLKGDDRALTAREQKGLRLFLEVGCATCHSGPTLGGQTYHKMGLVKPYANAEDTGRFGVTKDEGDKFKFKVPSLRNIALTAPYFHDGRVPQLNEATRTMADLQLGRELSAGETDLLVAFLRALTDKPREPARN